MSVFRFKQFEVLQREDVFKVGTDAVLLGALVAQHEGANHALEIGSGTGIISLMMAQRFPELSICAIDMSDAAFELTHHNFNLSPFKEQLDAKLTDATSFKTDKKFDLIVSNPPYFNQSTLSSTLANARHTLSLAHEELVSSCTRNISDHGAIWIILPPNEMDNLKALFEPHGFSPELTVSIHTRPEMSITRNVVCFTRADVQKPREQLIYIRNESDEFSSTYMELTREFHPFF